MMAAQDEGAVGQNPEGVPEQHFPQPVHQGLQAEKGQTDVAAKDSEVVKACDMDSGSAR